MSSPNKVFFATYRTESFQKISSSSFNSDAELEEDSTIRKFRIVQEEGFCQVGLDTKHYSAQMIIAVGFKVNSDRAVCR